MKDADFQPDFVPRHASAKAGRDAILKPFNPTLKLNHNQSIPPAVERVLKLWRRRCCQLRNAGWSPAAGATYPYMRNCPPTCIAVAAGNGGRFWRPCHKTAVCPWCWDREVVYRTFKVVEAEMDRTGCLPDRRTRLYPDLPPYKLCCEVRRGSVPDGDNQPDDILDIVETYLRKAKGPASKNSHGWGQIGVVWPKNGGGWSYSCRYLYLVPVDTPVVESARTAFPATRRKVASLVGRFARYPASWLLGDVNEHVKLLEARKGRRLLRLGGAFWNQGAEDDRG